LEAKGSVDTYSLSVYLILFNQCVPILNNTFFIYISILFVRVNYLLLYKKVLCTLRELEFAHNIIRAELEFAHFKFAHQNFKTNYCTLPRGCIVPTTPVIHVFSLRNILFFWFLFLIVPVILENFKHCAPSSLLTHIFYASSKCLYNEFENPVLYYNATSSLFQSIHIHYFSIFILYPF